MLPGNGVIAKMQGRILKIKAPPALYGVNISTIYAGVLWNPVIHRYDSAANKGGGELRDRALSTENRVICGGRGADIHLP